MKQAKTFAEALAILQGDLQALKNAAEVATFETLTKYADDATKRAKRALNRPHWLLSRSTAGKVVKYPSGKQVAIVGFQRTTNDSRAKKGSKDPGIYGRYYQSGKRRGIPRRFLFNAKIESLQGFGERLAGAFDVAVNKIATGDDLRAELAQVNARAAVGAIEVEAVERSPRVILETRGF